MVAISCRYGAPDLRVDEWMDGRTDVLSIQPPYDPSFQTKRSEDLESMLPVGVGAYNPESPNLPLMLMHDL